MLSSRIALPCLLLLAACGFAAAGTQEVAVSGKVYRVTVEQLGPDPADGTQLRMTTFAPDGTLSDSVVVPGTEDAWLDVDPSLDVDKFSGAVVIAWARSEGGFFDIYVARGRRDNWRGPDPVATTPANSRSPNVTVATDQVHVHWEENAIGQVDSLRVALDRGSLDVAWAPEVLDRSGPSLPAGHMEGGSQGDTPKPDQIFMTGKEPPVAGKPGKIHVWGVRDEPVPVEFKQSFDAPAGVAETHDVRTGWTDDTFVVSFVGDAAALWYITHAAGDWSFPRAIPLDEQTDAAAARDQLEKMLRR